MIYRRRRLRVVELYNIIVDSSVFYMIISFVIRLELPWIDFRFLSVECCEKWFSMTRENWFNLLYCGCFQSQQFMFYKSIYVQTEWWGLFTRFFLLQHITIEQVSMYVRDKSLSKKKCITFKRTVFIQNFFFFFKNK